MRRIGARAYGLIGAGALGLAIPVLAQSGPESLLPPGFGDPPPPAQPVPAPTPAAPRAPAAPATAADDNAAAPPDEALGNAMAAEAEEPPPAAEDLPETARRSLDQVGPLTATTGGFSPDAFGAARGPFLVRLMEATRAPLASRWASILLRRALLSGVRTPDDVDGADFVAARAWLLLRMGEADAARMLVQSVDPDRYTARLYAVAMQTYLASADPAGLCPLADRASGFSTEPSWDMAHAICASFAADQGTASAILNQAQRRGRVTGIDYRLTEKAVGAGPNGRRSVKIEWDGVGELTAWRFGLATATNVPIPDALYATVGPHVRAWEARAPMLDLAARRPAVDVAGRLGVFSAAAMRDFYVQLAADPDADDATRDLGDQLRAAYAGGSVADRVAGMRAVWTRPDGDGVDYARLLPLARAAAALPPDASVGGDGAWIIAAMLAAGYDRNAQGWARRLGELDDADRRAWALLAVGTPDRAVDLSRGRVSALLEADAARGRMLVASLAGLGRLAPGDEAALLADAGLAMPASRWARALNAAAARGERGTVALLVAVGLQVSDWRRVPPAHLLAITLALRQVGLEPEARMIAAEAMTRL
jgi:hypothetical protein